MADQPAGMALFTRWTLNAVVWVHPGSMNGST